MASYVITPNSDIILLKCPLEIDSLHQIDFANATAQYNYFYGLTKKIMDDATYQRKDGRLYFDGDFDTCVNYNYCMYRNTGYSNKWFYAFVTDMRFENNNCCSCRLVTDVFQTWMFDVTYKYSFIERYIPSKNSDTIGAFTYPEGFELGDYEGAISNFETVTEYRQDSELLFYSLAQAYEVNNEIDKAISNYLKSIAVNDKFTLAYKKVGILFMARNDFEDAVEYFEEYINFDIPQQEKDSVEKLVERIKAKNLK